jgi:hypothetical protein
MKSRVCLLMSRVLLFLTVSVAGVTAAQAQFSLSVTSPLSIPTQQYAPATVTITPQADGWTGTVVLTCGTMPAYASCIFPNAIQTFAVTANTPATATVYVNTSEIYKYQSKLQPSRIEGRIKGRMEGVALCSLFAPAMFLLFTGKRRKKAAGMMLFALVLLPLGLLTGCTGMRPPSTPPGTYSVVMTGYSGYYTTTTTMTLVVTP